MAKYIKEISTFLYNIRTSASFCGTLITNSYESFHSELNSNVHHRYHLNIFKIIIILKMSHINKCIKIKSSDTNTSKNRQNKHCYAKNKILEYDLKQITHYD